jgi:hypothetical protein
MGVTHRIIALPARGRAGAQAARWRSDRADGALFLRSQSAWLRRGLEAAEDPAAVGVVLSVHEASHERWLGLIGELEAAGDPSAPAVSGLYEFHGRIVGFLERGLDRRLDARVCKGIRSLLVLRLRELTCDTVHAVERGAPAPTPTPPAHPA